MLARSICALLLLLPTIARATSFTCNPPPDTPLCQFSKQIGVTFVGTPIATNYNPDNPVDPVFANTWYQFRIEEAFTGLRPDETSIRVYLSLGGGHPEVGRRFFVHARQNGNVFHLASCGISGPAEKASAEIAYLRAKVRGDFQPFIAGSILRHYSQSQYAVEPGFYQSPRGLANVAVTLLGPSGTLTVQTDPQGKFRRENVRPGKYTVAANAPGYHLTKPYTIEVPPNGCGIGHVGVFTDAGISGVVRRSDGTPAAKLELDLIDVDPHFHSRTDYGNKLESGPNGEFSISNLPSGKFLLGFNIERSTRYPDQTPPTYYPGVASRSSAQPIELKPNEHKKNIVLTLPPPRPFRTVRVNIRLPDGSIPAGGAIDAWAHKGIYLSNYDPKQGQFQLKLLQGVDYWLTAAARIPSRHPTRFANHAWQYADNYRLPAGNDDVEITLTGIHPEPQWPKAIYAQ